MFYGIRNADRGSLRNAEETKRLLQSSPAKKVLHVRNPTIEREVSDVPVSHSSTTLVVTELSQTTAEEAEPMAPHRALPLKLKVGKPVRSFDYYGTLAGVCPSQLDSNRITNISDSLRRLLH